MAVTVTEQYDDWEHIRGVQLWGVAKRVTGPAKVAAMAAYLRRFPFVDELMEQPRLAAVHAEGRPSTGSSRSAWPSRTTPRECSVERVLDLKG